MKRQPEGRLSIVVEWDGRRVTQCTIGSSRPVDACRLLLGRQPGQVLPLIGRMYQVCGRAQGGVSRSALEAALQRPPPDTRNRRLAVLGENAAEYLWRFLIDLPQWSGRPPQAAVVAKVRSHLAVADVAMNEDGERQGPRWEAFRQVLDAALERHVFGMPAPAWLQLSQGEWREWLARGQTPVALCLADLDAAGLGEWGASPLGLMPFPLSDAALNTLSGAAQNGRFADRPHLNGQVVETGAVARCGAVTGFSDLHRRHANAPFSRLLARLVELAQTGNWIERVLAGDAGPPVLGTGSPREGIGTAWAETARGLLLHRVEIAEGHIADYRIVAPTEWNFHPRGPLALGLEGAAASNQTDLERAVRLSVLALDPCVAYELEVRRA